ncbi:MAG: hypothetical protein IKU72_03540 [Oscillospiraceae bacterium]|nr:hypothetical protein [Oscillospiraceae bacterium]
MKKIICVLLSVLIVLNMTACAQTKPIKLDRSGEFTVYGLPVRFNDPFAARHADVAFAEIADYRYDGIEALKEALTRMEELCEEEDSLPQLQQLYAFCYEELTKLNTAETIASIQYDISTNSSKRKQTSLQTSAWQAEATTLYEKTIQQVLASRYGKDMTRYIGSDVAQLFDSDISDFDRLAQLLMQEDELLKKYNQRAAQLGFSSEKRGLDLAEIYLELVKVRKEIADVYGYESAAQYYYTEVYSRDYTPAEAAKFHANVKEYILPVYERISQSFDGKTDAVIKQEEIVPILQQYLPRISTEMAAMFDDMVDRGMIYFADKSLNHMSGAYTTRIQQFAQPFIYNGIAVEDYRAVTYTAHEFGHYCDASLNGLYGAKNPAWIFDLAEVFSSGLEILLYQYYDEMFAEDVSDEKTAQLLRYLELIILGCMYDQAQQEVFDHQGELTVEDVNNIFLKTAEEYRMPTTGGKYFWTNNLHNFRYPFYYLSYAVAYATSAELWLVAQTRGQQAAIQTYLEMLSIGSFEYSYSRVMKTCGMKGFSSEKMLQQLAQRMGCELDKLQNNPQTTP